MNLEPGASPESEGVPLSRSVHTLLSVAQNEATARQHAHLGPEHLLLGLCDSREDTTPSPLAALGIDVEQLHSFVNSVIGQERVTSALTASATPLSGRARQSMTLASAAAQEFGHREVQLADVVVGLTREGNNIAAQMLMDRGVTADHAVALARAQD